MSKEIQYAHRGIVKSGQFLPDRPDMLNKEFSSFEDKRIIVSIEKETKSRTPSQLGYYFGGIIQGECMNSNSFSGWTKEEIHQYFMKKLRRYSKTMHYESEDRTIIQYFTEDFSAYNREKMTKYIEDVKNYLANEESIICKEPEEYLLNKYENKRK